jgi:anthranilate synthase component II
MKELLIIDNNDSFTFNLVQLVRESGDCRFTVRRYKDTGLDEMAAFDKILISPGPGVPEEYPLLRSVILQYCTVKSILGVCLGHQAIAAAFGLPLFNLGTVMHGIRTTILLEEEPGYLFNGVPREFAAGLYHSWAVAANDPAQFRVTAMNSEGIIMGLAHREYDLQGVQFHPESFMTEYGREIVGNWLRS